MCGKEFGELGGQLGGQRLVVRQHQRGTLHGVDNVGDGEGLAGSRDAEQRLAAVTGVNALDELRNRLGLVARRPIGRLETKSRRGLQGWAW